MTNTILTTAKSVIKHWYLIFLVGLIFIIAGIRTAMTPLSSYLTLSFLFGLSFLLAGVTEIIFSLMNRKEMKGWGWTLVYGLFNLTIGIILLNNPLLSITTLPLYIGYAVLFRSIMTIGISLDSENYGMAGSGGLLAAGILGVIFAFILLWNPGFAGLSLVIYTAAALITAGFYSIAFSLRLKKLS